MRNALRILLIIIVTNTIVATGQNNTIDKYVLNLKLKRNISVNDAIKKITKKSKTDYDKIRAFYVWIANNVSYDVKAFFSGQVKSSDSKYVLKHRKAVCQGYSNLFKAFCDKSGIKSYVVSGFSKGYGFTHRKKLKRADHAWNIVYVNNNWYNIDVTWSSGHLNSKGKYVKKFSDEWFLINPKKFILTHLPEDPIYQLLPCYISAKTYLKDSTLITKQLLSCRNPKMTFPDTLNAFAKKDSITQMIESANRIVQFLPSNGTTAAVMYNQVAFSFTQNLNSNKISINTKLEKAKNGLKYYQLAKTVLANNSGQQARQLRNIIKQNINNTTSFIKFYTKH